MIMDTDAIAETDNIRASSPRLLPNKTALLFAVPPDDLEEFHRDIPGDERDEVNKLLNYCGRIYRAEKQIREMQLICSAPGNKGKRGYSIGGLTRKYYAYINSGDWRELVNRSKAPEEKLGLPKQFVEFLRARCEDNQRVSSAAIDELVYCIWKTRFDRQGRQYKEIPGYAEWPKADPRTGRPVGWTDRNLYRYMPDDYSLELARKGRAGASELRLKVYRTRAGLRVGEFYQFDDHEYNVKVNFPGQFRAMRPRGFTAIDVLSAYAFAKSFKPTLWDEAEEKKKTLTEKDMAWFVIHVLCDIGYRTDDRGTALCVEWGTAAIREALEQRIIDATCGKVRIERSGKFGTEGGGRLALASQFKGQPKGNFRFKALIEQFWRSIDDALASLPGQVGKDRNHSPEQLHGAEKHNDTILEIAAALNLPVAGPLGSAEERAAGLRTAFMTWNEFTNAAMTAYDAIGGTHRHALEGWLKCGFERKQWRLDPSHDWLPFERLLALPDESRKIAEALIHTSDALTSVRKFSRREAFESGRDELTRLPAFHFPTLMGIENAVRGGEPIPVSEGVIEFEDSDIDSDPVRFKALDRRGERLDDKYVCFVNPFNPSVLVACDAKLRVVAECPRMEASCHNNREGIKRQMGAARSWEAKAVATVDLRHLDKAREIAAMHEHNGDKIAGRKFANEKQFKNNQDRLAALGSESIYAEAGRKLKED